MEFDLKPFFKEYEKLVSVVDDTFNRVKNEYPECVKCKIECADCCHALFDLTLIEAIYINHYFQKTLTGAEKEKLIETSNRVDREIFRIKKKACKDLESGKNESELLNEMATKRIKCPLLNDDNKCALYQYRPITCRLYGIPTSIGGQGHTCGLSGFVEGQQYPSVNLDKIQNRLYEISNRLTRTIKSKHIKMGEMIIPLSMAILTEYDNDYLGLPDKDNIAQKQNLEKSSVL